MPHRCRATFLRSITLSLAFLAGGSASHADVVLLKNGNSLSGRSKRLPDGRIELQLDHDKSITLDPATVESVTKAECSLDVFERRFEKIGGKDRNGLVDLANWARREGLRNCSELAYAKVLRIDPNHEDARRALGYVLHENRWKKKESLKRAGLVRFRGEWMTPEAVERIRVEELEKELDASLADLSHENRFIRENALAHLITLKEPRLIPRLIRELDHEEPVRRMVAGRALTNHGADASARPLYDRLLLEPREEVAQAWIVSLGALRDVRIARWIATDLSRRESTALARRRLLELTGAVPHSEVVPALIAWSDDPRWGSFARARLAEWFGREMETASSRAERQRIWAASSKSGWLRERRGE